MNWSGDASQPSSDGRADLGARVLLHEVLAGALTGARRLVNTNG
jgi:hypothetical protein